jgi:hypothetical protein
MVRGRLLDRQQIVRGDVVHLRDVGRSAVKIPCGIARHPDYSSVKSAPGLSTEGVGRRTLSP